jgi:hypothetical protein
MSEYDASQHPEVKAGNKTAEEVFKEYLDSFEVRAFPLLTSLATGFIPSHSRTTATRSS